MTDEPTGAFHENDDEPDWYREMIEANEVNVVHNALVATLGYTAEELNPNTMAVENIHRGEDFAIVFETDHPHEEGAIVRALFTISPAGALSIAHMILRRFPHDIVSQIAYEATARPGPPVQHEMQPAVPPSQEGVAFIERMLDKRARGYEKGQDSG